MTQASCANFARCIRGGRLGDYQITTAILPNLGSDGLASINVADDCTSVAYRDSPCCRTMHGAVLFASQFLTAPPGNRP